MTIRKKHNIRHYTIVEVMVAMAIFLVMMTIMMQFFTSAQKVWNLSSKRNDMYADARVAMNLMTREIQSMLYRNEAVDDIYPFWFEWTTKNVDLGGETTLLTDEDNYNLDYLTALNFIAYTDLKSEDAVSDICEIRYKFIPIYFDATPTVGNVKGGTLKRSCTEKTDPVNANYNFETNPYGTGNRVDNIWNDSSSDTFITVISGIYSLRFTCYRWTGTGLDIIDVMNNTGKGIDNNPIQPPSYDLTYNLIMGTPVPVAVRIDMKLLAPGDLKKLAFNIYMAVSGPASGRADAEKQIRTLKQKLRTFSKVIYLGRREN